MTVSALRTVCLVASAGSDAWVGYDEIARRSGLAHTLAVHQIVQLCANGKDGKQPALLIKREEQDRRFRSAALSEAGRSVAARFVPPGPTVGVSTYMQDCVLPALQIVLSQRPGLALGTLTVLLYIARHQDKFGFEGAHVREVSNSLGISNLTRHLAALSEGSSEQPEHGFVTLITNPKDRRAKLPEVTVEGHAFVAKIAAALIKEEVIPPRHPSEEQINALPDSRDVDTLEWDELLDIEGWDDIVWVDERDQSARPDAGGGVQL